MEVAYDPEAERIFYAANGENWVGVVVARGIDVSELGTNEREILSNGKWRVVSLRGATFKTDWERFGEERGWYDNTI